MLGDMTGALSAALRRFGAKGGWVMSSHVAMSMILALFPFVLFVLSLAAWLSQDVVTDDVIELIFGTWPDAIAGPITAELRTVLSMADPGLLTVGGVLAIYFASNGVDAIRVAMSNAYRSADPRPFWRTRGLCLIFVLFGGAAVLITATLGLVLPLYFQLVADAVEGPVAAWLDNGGLRNAITLGLLISGVTACHYWLPGLRHPLRQIWPGVVLTILLWSVAGQGFSFYISRFGGYSATYAGLAGAMAALIFLYLMAAILILGAEFNGALIERDRQRRD